MELRAVLDGPQLRADGAGLRCDLFIAPRPATIVASPRTMKSHSDTDATSETLQPRVRV